LAAKQQYSSYVLGQHDKVVRAIGFQLQLQPMHPQAISAPKTKDIFNLAWPLALNGVMLHGIVVIDAFLVSSIGEHALAAMGLASSIAGLLLGVLFAFNSATQILVAQAYGSGNPVSSKTSFFCGLFINISVAVLGVALIYAFGDSVISHFAQTAWIGEQAQNYLHAFIFVVISEAIAQCLSAHFNGVGQTRLPFYSYVITLPINIFFSLVLIHGLYGFPQLGVVGAAIGSALAALTRAVYLGVCMAKLNHYFSSVQGWSQGSFTPSLKKHFVFSLPIAGTFISLTTANSACMLLFAKLSVNQFAAMTLILPWIQAVGQLMIAWTRASGIIVAQLLGRSAPDDVLDVFLQRSWRSAFAVAAGVAAIYAAISVSFEVIYTNLEAETLAALWSFLPMLLILTFPKVSNAVCGATLRAGGDTVYFMNVSFMSQWLLRVPLTALLILSLELSVTWVFATFLLEEVVKFPAFHKRLHSGVWRQKLTT